MDGFKNFSKPSPSPINASHSTDSKFQLFEDDLCSSILAQFERMGIKDAIIADCGSGDGMSTNDDSEEGGIEE